MSALKGPLGIEKGKAQYQQKLGDKTRGGYRQIEIMYEEEEETPKAQSTDRVELKPVQESKLDRRVQDFIRLIFDIKQIKSTLAEIGYDSNKMPLGKLSQRTLQQGY
jgi:poly [ADP-ribose] polymerase